MSPSLRRVSSTVSSHNSEHNTAGYSHRPKNGDFVEEIANNKTSSVDSATVTQTALMPPDAIPSSLSRASPTVSFHPSGHRIAGHSSDPVEDAPHRSDTCDIVQPDIVVETGATRGSWVNVNTKTQTAPAQLDAILLSPERSLHNTSVQSAASHDSDRVEHRTCAHNAPGVEEQGTGKNSWIRWLFGIQMSLMFLDAVTLVTHDTTPPPLGRVTSTVSSHISDRGAAGHNFHRIKEASRRRDTCNVVIFGETGSGKSSLVNLITGRQTAQTSPDATGCTTEITLHEHDVVTQGKTVKVQLFDTPGLDEGPHGTVSTMQGQIALRTLLRTLKKNRGIHLVMYCVQGTKDISTLQRNYKLLPSKVKGKVPIVLVATGLETRQPDMEEWWKNNEKSISDLGMTFAGHACITAVAINEDDTDEIRQRHEQSYHTVWNLIEQRYPQNGTGISRVTTPPPVRKTKNIVLFGEAGAGKSSVVNLMAGKEVAITSLGMRRCTLHWQDYVVDFDGESYKVFDTIGIEESGLEMKEYLAAVANAYRFIKALDDEGGVDLLLFCIRAGRFTAALQSNYRFFYEFLCEKKVPIVLAITNLEREQRMEDWWEREHNIFARYQIHVADHACITAANGLEGIHQQLYEKSRVAIRKLVKQNIASEHDEVWMRGNLNNVFVSLVGALKKLLVKNSHIRKMNLIGQLTKRCGMPRETAELLADRIEEVRIDAA